jgi:NAD(P)-dependent dehydrogenase (short-subunit alcohol dehydrogenase family)
MEGARTGLFGTLNERSGRPIFEPIHRRNERMPDVSRIRVALVSGGTGQLGRHVVERLLRDGIHTHVPVLDEHEEEATRGHLGGGASAVTFHPRADLTDPASVDTVFRTVAEREGRSPDILLNLAGGFAGAAVEETDPATWDHLWKMNASTAFLCSRAAFPGMKAAGWGRVVNVSAFPAIDRGKATLSAYGAAKAAVLSLTHTLAREGVRHGITVNAILPSIIDTASNRAAMPGADTSTWLPPEGIAEVIAFLVSDAAGMVNGAAIPLTLG